MNISQWDLGPIFVFVMLEVLTSAFRQEYFSSVFERKKANKAVIDVGVEKAVVTGLRAVQMNHFCGTTWESNLKSKA